LEFSLSESKTKFTHLNNLEASTQLTNAAYLVKSEDCNTLHSL